MGSRQPSYAKPETTAKQQKNDRLAKALRDNLHRRKAQARSRTNSTMPNVSNMTDNDDQEKR